MSSANSSRPSRGTASAAQCRNLAFVGKLLLNSLDKLKQEYCFKYEYEAWKAMQRDAVHLSDPPVPIPPGTKPLPATGDAFAAELLATAPEVAHNS